MTDVVLKFISGPLQGCEFPLENDQEVVIGRADDAGLRIIDDTVSRKHARIFFRNDEIVIEDLSKNGTFVNSRPVRKAILMSDDLIYIGRSVMRVIEKKTETTPIAAITGSHPLRLEAVPQATVSFALRGASGGAVESTYQAVAPMSAKAAPSPLATSGAPVPIAARTSPTAPRPQPKPGQVGSSTGEHFRGSIGDIAMTDLLQLLSSSRKSGIMVLRYADMLGKIYLDKGQICYATMDEVEPVNPQKVFFRLMRWSQGSFEFSPPTGRDFPSRLNESIDHLLLEAMHELDEINNLGPDLPSLHAEVQVVNPLPSPLKDLASGDLDFIQLAMRHKMVRDILDHYTGTDFEGYTYLKSLTGRRFLEITL